MAKRRCSECGEVYDAAFQHCPACGAEHGRRIARCRKCGSRLPSMFTRRCPMCGAALISFGWVRPLVKIALASAVIFFLAATYAYSYVPQLGAVPTPFWPTPTSTATVTPTVTATVAVPTRTRTPTNTPVPPTVTKIPPLTYTIISGDTLWDIAMSHNTSVEALKIANGMGDDYVIKPGQVLIIPRGTPTPMVQPSATPKPQPPVTRLPVPTSTPNP